MSLVTLFAKIKKLAHAVLPKQAVNAIRMYKNSKKRNRRLDIGPGGAAMPGYETLDIAAAPWVDYVLDASAPLPFGDDTFVEIHASHVLEHLPWYNSERILREWVRILAPGGWLKVIVPDGLKACQVLLEYEIGGRDMTSCWPNYEGNPEKDPCVWANRFIYAHGEWTGDSGHPQWHHALFTPRYLKQLLEKVGLTNVQQLSREETVELGHWSVSIALKGQKPSTKRNG